MKMLLTTLFLLLPTLGRTQQFTSILPEQIIAILDSTYSGWALVDNFSVLKEPVMLNLKLDTMKCHPNLVWGDFDCNELLDYAVYIEQSMNGNLKRRFVIAFLNNGKGYDSYPFEGSSDYIWLVKKGKKLYDHEKLESIYVKCDGIVSVWIESAAETFLFEDGMFKRIITSD